MYVCVDYTNSVSPTFNGLMKYLTVKCEMLPLVGCLVGNGFKY